VRSGCAQLSQLVSWAAPFPTRTWAIESASGLGYLLAQQLVAAGETVVDVPATPSATRSDPPGARGSGVIASSVLAAGAISRPPRNIHYSKDIISPLGSDLVDTCCSEGVPTSLCQEVWNPAERFMRSVTHSVCTSPRRSSSEAFGPAAMSA
ncbi:MAG TPA: hypothetical protein VFD59_13375, partial [Nocardioidaceae bacterium]|nr:hypothetical protein [Nocardioidaceae bacterium]